MIHVGQRLREAREARSMSIEEVARITRIPRSTLGAIEDGHIAQLPAPVFVRGFVRSYAELVGLDANELLRDLRLGSEPTEAPDALVSTVTSADAVTGSRRSPTLPPYAPLFGDAEPVASSGIGFSHAALIVLAFPSSPSQQSGVFASLDRLSQEDQRIEVLRIPKTGSSALGNLLMK